MQLKKREIDKIFKKLKMEIKTSHHRMAYFCFKGKKILKTRRSHGKGDMKSTAIEQLINQLFLTKKQFQDLKNCPLTYEDYIRILKEKEKIEA